jgi:hypothetical protein
LPPQAAASAPARRTKPRQRAFVSYLHSFAGHDNAPTRQINIILAQVRGFCSPEMVFYGKKDVKNKKIRAGNSPPVYSVDIVLNALGGSSRCAGFLRKYFRH